MEWDQEAKDLLEDLIKPIPVFVRPMAKKGIERRIIEAAENDRITRDAVIRGYIMASPGDMQERAVKLLQIKGVDMTAYEDLLQQFK